MEPSKYERRALERIHEWKNPELGWFGQTMQQIGWPGAMQDLGSFIGRAGDAVGATALFDVFNKAVAGTVSVLSDAAGSTIKPEAVHAAYRKAGHDVQQRTDVFCLDLERVDETVGRLDAKYKGFGVHARGGGRRGRDPRVDCRHSCLGHPELESHLRVRHVPRIRRFLSGRTVVRASGTGLGFQSGRCGQAGDQRGPPRVGQACLGQHGIKAPALEQEPITASASLRKVVRGHSDVDVRDDSEE